MPVPPSVAGSYPSQDPMRIDLAAVADMFRASATTSPSSIPSVTFAVASCCFTLVRVITKFIHQYPVLSHTLCAWFPILIAINYARQI